MTAYLIVALLLGTAAGAAPGPYTTMVIGTALQRGFRAALKLAVVPIATDILPLLLTVFILDALNATALTLLGITGGVIIAVVGLRFIRHQGPPVMEGEEPFQSATFGHAAASTFFSPAPWFFWLIVAGPLTLGALEVSTTTGVLFVAILFATNMGTAALLAWLVSHSRNLMSQTIRDRVLQVTGAVLMAAGVLLVWQSMEGNFQAMMNRQEALRDAIDARLQ